MGWSIGHDSTWDRDIGYGVPAYCDHPQCMEEIDRGLAYVCGGEPYGGDDGCGLYFCGKHRGYNSLCPRCQASKPPYKHPKPDHPTWLKHKLTDSSWAEWRAIHPADVTKMKALLQWWEERKEIGARPAQRA